MLVVDAEVFRIIICSRIGKWMHDPVTIDPHRLAIEENLALVMGPEHDGRAREVRI